MLIIGLKAFSPSLIFSFLLSVSSSGLPGSVTRDSWLDLTLFSVLTGETERALTWT